MSHRGAALSSASNRALLALCAASLIGLLVNVAFPARNITSHSAAAEQLGRTALAPLLAVVVVVGPGLALKARNLRLMPSMSYLALPGIGLLSGMGLLSWLLASRMSTGAVATAR